MMKKAFYLAVCLCLSGCADNAQDEIINYCDSGKYQNCSTTRDAGDCLKGCDNPLAEAKDTYLPKFEGNLAENQYSTDDGYVGSIDSDCRKVGDDKYRGDLDLIAIEATPGTPLSITVSRSGGSKTRPIVLLYNSRGDELIYTVSDKFGYTNLKFLAPEKKFYVSVEEYDNYRLGQITYCAENQLVGGDDYRYLLRVTNTELHVKDLGTAGSSFSTEDKLESMGETKYYKIKTGAKTQKLEFDIKRLSSNADNYPVISPLRRNTNQINFAGGYEWVQYGNLLNTRKDDEDTAHYSFPIEYASCSDVECEFWFVVTDYYGSYGYDYSIKISEK